MAVTKSAEYQRRYRIRHAVELAVRRKKNIKHIKRWWRNYHLKIKYGLTINSFKKLLYKQNGTCALCKTQRDRPVVDHNHLSNKVRGILCHKCNAGIGFFEDNVQLLKQAIKYLKDTA